MDNIKGTEWMVFIATMMSIILASFTKVEESFNTNAIHDVIYHKWNISEYDHNVFPGVVPRTFVGALSIGVASMPFVGIMSVFHASKYWSLCIARIILGCGVLLSFCNFARSVEKHFGEKTAHFLRLIVASQFHFLFYASRPLPNTFALIPVLYIYTLLLDGRYIRACKVATFTAFVFRFELILLFGPLFLPILLTRQLPISTAVLNGLWSLFVSLLITIPIDSLFWGRWIYPEGEVVWFNVFQNKSHLYGTSPLWWYFSSALPRALGATLILVPFGLYMETRLRKLIIPGIIFVILYSALPHKELRFIIYVFPLLNLAAANFMARAWINKDKSFVRKIFALGIVSHLAINLIMTMLMMYVSARNYAGGDALAYLQHMQRFDKHKNISVHIDEYAAQTGISKFVHYYDAWNYDKNESSQLDPEALADHHFIIVGDYKEDVKQKATKVFGKSHRQYFGVETFDKLHMVKSKKFPYYWPILKFKDKLVVMRRKGDA